MNCSMKSLTMNWHYPTRVLPLIYIIIYLCCLIIEAICYTQEVPKFHQVKGHNVMHSVQTLNTNQETQTLYPLSSQGDDELQPRTLPFSMIVGQERIKEALTLLASNPRIGGVLISGGHGTGKSVLAKALHKLLPKKIKRVKGSLYNIDPTGKYGLDTFLLNELLENRKELGDLDVEDVNTPFCTIPLNVMEDSLVGTIDIEKSVEVGHNVFLPGLLAKAHRGILYIDDINLLDENIVDILFDVISEGYVKVEREGLSVQYPCVPLVVATFNEDEGEVRDHLKDRIAISLSSNEKPLSVIDRVKAVDNFIIFSGDLEQRNSLKSARKLMTADNSDLMLSEKIEEARSLLDSVKISHEQMLYLCEEATRAGCEGQRAEIFAVEVAKSNAAFHGRSKVGAEDLKVAAKLTIVPRARFLSDDYLPNEDDNESLANADQQTSDMMPMSPSTPEEIQQTEEERDIETTEKDITETNGHDQDQEHSDEVMELPTEFMFSVTGIPLDPELLHFAQMSKKGKGGKSSRLFNLIRGRYVKPIFPKAGQKGRLAIGATLRAAAPLQRFRRSMAIGTRKEGKAVYVEKSDFRIKRMKRKAGALIIFVVDASGSMALNRMDAAKGAAIGLLSEAYKARDKISLVTFHGERAEVLVPPTKSTALTKARLEGMPCGGGSPLAHALVTAARVAVNECKIKKDVGKVIIVLISDGRANIPLCISEGERFDPIIIPSIDGRPTKKFLYDEVMSCAKQLGKMDCSTIVIDTEDKFVSTGIARDIASASLAKYYCIDARNTAAIRAVTSSNL